MNRKFTISLLLCILLLLAIPFLVVSCRRAATEPTVRDTPVVPYPIPPSPTPPRLGTPPVPTPRATPTPRIPPTPWITPTPWTTLPTGRTGVIGADFSLTGTPTLGNVVTLTLTIASKYDSPSTTMQIYLPVEMTQVGGTLEWHGSLKAGETRQMTTQARVVQNGYFTVSGWAQADYPPSMRLGGGNSLHLVVEDQDAWVSREPPKNNWTPSNAALPGEQNPHLIQSQFFLSGTLVLDRIAHLIYEITPLVNLHDAEIVVILPKTGVEVAEAIGPPGSTQYRPYGRDINALGYRAPTLSGGQKITVVVTIRTVATGEGHIYAWTRGLQDDGTRVVQWQELRRVQVYTPRAAR